MSAFTQIHRESYPFISPDKFKGKLASKVVLITGASRGIGRTTALALAAAGASIAAVARSQPELDALVNEIKTKYSVPAISIAADLLKTPAVDIVKQVETELGLIDILINNAGVTRMRNFHDEDLNERLESWWQVLEINVKAPLQLVQAVLPSFLRPTSPSDPTPRGGTIITLGSNMSTHRLPYFTSYSASKAAIQKAMELIYLEVQDKNVRSYTLEPGFLKTDMTTNDGVVFEGKDEEQGHLQGVMDGFLAYAGGEEGKELAGNAILAVLGLDLAAAEDDGQEKKGIRSLSGRFLDVMWDLEKVLEEVEVGNVEKGDLLRLKIATGA